MLIWHCLAVFSIDFCHESKHDMSLHFSNSFTQKSRLSWLSIFPMGSIDICSNSHETTFASCNFTLKKISSWPGCELLDRAPQPILARAVGVSWSSKFGGGKKVMVRVRGVWWWWVPQPEKLHAFPVKAKDVELELLVFKEKCSMSRRTSSSLPLSEAGGWAIGPGVFWRYGLKGFLFWVDWWEKNQLETYSDIWLDNIGYTVLFGWFVSITWITIDHKMSLSERIRSYKDWTVSLSTCSFIHVGMRMSQSENGGTH